MFKGNETFYGSNLHVEAGVNYKTETVELMFVMLSADGNECVVHTAIDELDGNTSLAVEAVNALWRRYDEFCSKVESESVYGYDNELYAALESLVRGASVHLFVEDGKVA